MWADNEVSVDLLNVGHIKAAVLKLVDDDNVAPVTIGVYGRWGSGKSTVLRLVQSELVGAAKKEAGVVCVWFNSWQFESYDDSKAALMSAILEELREQRGTLVKAKGSLLRFAKRVEWMRLAGLAAKGVTRVKLAALTMGGSEVLRGVIDTAKGAVSDGDVGDLPELIKKDEEEVGAGPHSVREFREEFARLLEVADISRLVVIIDDLDRCLPDRVVDTLEAIKLFLLVPRTAFILGADEDVVRRSVQARFAAVADVKEQLGRDYLEKLIQIPVPVPPMSQEEAEGYMNLLFAQLRLDQDAFRALCAERAAAPLPSLGEVPFSFDDAKRFLGAVPPQLQEDFTLVAQMGAILSELTEGNPRQTKRFLNSLMLRLEMARARGVPVRINVMAKLMLLEDAKSEAFMALGDWQRRQSGKPEELAILEKAAENGDAEKVDASLRSWLETPWLERWLRSEPKLADEDLGPYFYFARNRPAYAAIAQRLTPGAAHVFAALQSESEAERLSGAKAARALSTQEATSVFAALAEHLRQLGEAELAGDSSPLLALFALAAEKTHLVDELIVLLGRVPAGPLPIKTITQLASLTNHGPHSDAAQRLATKWATEDSATKIGRAAATAKRLLKSGPRPASPSRGGR